MSARHEQPPSRVFNQQELKTDDPQPAYAGWREIDPPSQTAKKLRRTLQRLFVSIARANADYLRNRVDEDLPVAHFARAGRFDDRIARLGSVVGFHADLQ